MNAGRPCGAAVVMAVLTVLLAGRSAAAHEVLHSVERGQAVALKAFFADGEVMAYVPYEIYSPRDARIPHQKGRTDRSGYVAFVPDAPGAWRVKVTDEAGHGLDTIIEAGMAPATGHPGTPGTAAFILRPLAGLVVVGLIFGALVLFHRRRRGGRT